MPEPIPCPVCMRRETMRARLDGYEPCHDDPALMRFRRPHGVGGQVITRWSGGSWECERCEIALTPHDAGVLLDAVLGQCFPDCDSIVDGMHEDARRALRGGSDA